MGLALSGRPHSHASIPSPEPVPGTAPLMWRPWPARAARPSCATRRRSRGYQKPTRGLLGLAAVPVVGGGAWPGFEIDHSEPKARVWRSRGRAAAHGHTKQPGRGHRSPAGPAAPSTRATLAQYIVVALYACQLSLRTNEAATGFPATASSMNERQREISATSTRAVTAATHTIAILRPTARISSRSISYSTSNDGGFRLASISNFTRSPPRTPTGSGLDLAFP